MIGNTAQDWKHGLSKMLEVIRLKLRRGGGWPVTDPDCPLDDRQLSIGLEERPVQDDQGHQSAAEKRGPGGRRRGPDGQ